MRKSYFSTIFIFILPLLVGILMGNTGAFPDWFDSKPPGYGSLAATTAIVSASIFPVALYVMGKKDDIDYFHKEISGFGSQDDKIENRNTFEFIDKNKEDIQAEARLINLGLYSFITITTFSSTISVALFFHWGGFGLFAKETYAVALHIIIFALFCSLIGAIYSEEFRVAFLRRGIFRYLDILKHYSLISKFEKRLKLDEPEKEKFRRKFKNNKSEGNILDSMQDLNCSGCSLPDNFKNPLLLRRFLIFLIINSSVTLFISRWGVLPNCNNKVFNIITITLLSFVAFVTLNSKILIKVEVIIILMLLFSALLYPFPNEFFRFAFFLVYYFVLIFCLSICDIEFMRLSTYLLNTKDRSKFGCVLLFLFLGALITIVIYINIKFPFQFSDAFEFFATIFKALVVSIPLKLVVFFQYSKKQYFWLGSAIKSVSDNLKIDCNIDRKYIEVLKYLYGRNF